MSTLATKNTDNGLIPFVVSNGFTAIGTTNCPIFGDQPEVVNDNYNMYIAAKTGRFPVGTWRCTGSLRLQKCLLLSQCDWVFMLPTMEASEAQVGDNKLTQGHWYTLGGVILNFGSATVSNVIVTAVVSPELGVRTRRHSWAADLTPIQGHR